MFSLFSHQLAINTSMSKCHMKKHSLSFKPLQQMLDSERSSQHIVSAREGLNTISCMPLSVITGVQTWFVGGVEQKGKELLLIWEISVLMQIKSLMSDQHLGAISCQFTTSP
jgi:hypothetical protein